MAYTLAEKEISMSGINEAIIRAIFQISCTFSCDIGNSPISIMGTGFFIRNNKGTLLFITNKHNLDPSLKLGIGTTYKLSKISLLLRKQLVDGSLSLETKWFDLKNCDGIKYSSSADVSAIYNFKLSTTDEINEYQPDSFAFSELADENYLLNNTSMMDMASFIGFPGKGAYKWWDQEGNIPIARTGNIASYPKKSFCNESVKTDEVVLFSGLSFSGSSGSPVFLHEKGIKLTGTPGQIIVKNDNYIPSKIIGIMSGHWWDNANEPEMFKHSGLSYFTKSTAIHKIIYDL